MHTAWTSDRIPSSRPKQPAQSQGKGKQKAQEPPKSKEVRRLEHLRDGLRYATGRERDPKGGCFCQGTPIRPASLCPLCRQQCRRYLQLVCTHYRRTHRSVVTAASYYASFSNRDTHARTAHLRFSHPKHAALSRLAWTPRSTRPSLKRRRRDSKPSNKPALPQEPSRHSLPGRPAYHPRPHPTRSRRTPRIRHTRCFPLTRKRRRLRWRRSIRRR